MAEKRNSFKTLSTLKVGSQEYRYHSLKKFEKEASVPLSRLPFSLKILLENILRYEDGVTARKEDLIAIAKWNSKAEPDQEIQFRPSRILLQDFTGVPAVADLAAMRGAIKALGGDPSKINPLQPADLVIDHSVQVDYYGSPTAFQQNVDVEFDRNRERYEFLRWGQSALKNFSVVPPGTGIVHQINLEYLAHVAITGKMDGETYVYPDSLVGTDSHTTMINGLGVLGWGVGGIEAEAAMLGQPITMLIPQVVGFRLKGKLPAGATATDLVLRVTEMLRKKGVVGKFVEFLGPGLASLSLADRATIANMAPEYGATVGLFPVDERTTEYLKLSGRDDRAQITESYYKEQGLWYSADQKEPEYTDVLELDLGSVVPALAGPSRPQDRVNLDQVHTRFSETLPQLLPKGVTNTNPQIAVKDPKGEKYDLHHGSVVIAAITSCTNTSNPSVMLAAGLVAKKAAALGLKAKPWVKTSLAPGSKVVTDYLEDAGLLTELEKLNFHLVGYGCTTCIGNSGPLPPHIDTAVKEGQLVVASVLSGNRNFEGRVSPSVRANFLASPPLVVAYAISGRVDHDFVKEPIAQTPDGKNVFLKDIWPTHEEISSLVQKFVTSKLFQKEYSEVFEGTEAWREIKFPTGDLYKWDKDSTYIKEPPFFEGLTKNPAPISNIKGAYVLALLKDSVTTDHISPAGSIGKDSPAGVYLQSHGVSPKDFNSYGARRGNHEVMVRGTFANVRLKNQLVPGIEGGFTKHIPSGKQTTIYDASMEYQAKGQPLIVLAGKEYGTGSSRDWAAKGTKLLGVRAVIAQSFERIHRSNLIGMGVLPLQFLGEESAESLGLKGDETFDLTGLQSLKPQQKLKVKATSPGGATREFEVLCRIDTPNELEYYNHGGILPYVLRQMLG